MTLLSRSSPVKLKRHFKASDEFQKQNVLVYEVISSTFHLSLTVQSKKYNKTY